MARGESRAATMSAFATRAKWRRWLRRHHAREREIWVMFYKAHTGKRGLTYGEAVEEAICFGWIDGIVRRLDEERYEQKFVPRRPGSTWSETNLRRTRRMIDAGAMTDAGWKMLGDKLERYERDGIAHRPPRADEASPQLMALLKANDDAWAHFQKLAPSHRRQYLGWVMAAKKEETRLRRMREVVAVLARGGKLGLK